MDLQTIYYVGEMLAAATVVASLIFVGFQMRQNARATKLQVTQNMLDMWAASNRDVLNNKELQQDLAQAFEAGSPSEAEANLRLYMWASTIIRQVEFAYFNWKNGDLADAHWRQTEVTLPQLIASDRMRQVWTELRPGLSREFRDMIESLAEKELKPLPKPPAPPASD